MCLASMKKMIWDTDNIILNKAKERAIAFCNKNGLSVAKLKTQSFYLMGDVAYFVQNVEYHGSGLKEDLLSQPKATLEYSVIEDSIKPMKYVYFLKD